MRTLALVLLLWPWSHHTETGVVFLHANGMAVVGFKKHFKRLPACEVSGSQQVKIRSHSIEWAEFSGAAGDKVTWTCRDYRP